MNWALLVGSVPRKAGMERKRSARHQRQDLHRPGQGDQKNAASDVRVLVVGNPCNTNCLIAMNNAPGCAARPLVRHDAPRREPRQDASSPTRPACTSREVTNVAIWGNHSATQYPDFYNAKIGGKPATDVITDTRGWRGDFITDRAAARRGHHQGARRVLGRHRGQRGDRHRALPHHTRPRPATGTAWRSAPTAATASRRD